ncbi:MAG: DUF3570 domain-containing protein [Nitrospirae bacterium]|nr:DUF3570 domain-containing protein [Nitrospirota bacterium]
MVATNIPGRKNRFRIAGLALGCIVVAAVFARGAAAEDYAVTQSYVHSFSNHVAVYTEVFALNKDVSLETSSYFKYTVDFINPEFLGEGSEGGEGGEGKGGVRQNVAAVSTASSAATGGGTTTDTRNELTAGFSHNFNNLITTEFYYDYSQEKDYLSNTPSITLKKDLFEKNTTLTLSYSKNMDLVYGRFMDGRKSRDTDNYYFGITQLLSPVTFAQIGYSGSRARGFIPEGNRLVAISPTTPDQCTAKAAGSCEGEVFPSTRSRNAVLLGINHYFSDGFMDRSSVKLTYRYYTDDWNITSHTEEAEYNKYVTDRNILGLNLRYYRQTAAFFAKDLYTAADRYRSSSQQLLALSSELAGLKYTHLFKATPGRSNGIRLGTFEARYEFYTETIHVTAHSVMIGLRFNF